jgi:ribosomal protein S18 acetylase RimI-like enzyme
MPSTETALVARPMRDHHESVVLGLINADRLPGQPVCTEEMLREAVAGRSPVDAAWWDELDQVDVEVVEDATGAVVGVVSSATRPRDRAGLVLWLHGREDPTVIGFLLDLVLGRWRDRPVVDAFDFATALGLGLEALPIRHRAATRVVLESRGFSGHDLWRYMHLPLARPGVPPAASVRVDVTAPEPTKRSLQIRAGGAALAEATIGVPLDGIGVLWWIGVDPMARGRGLGRELLGCALDQLSALGATEVILYVDDDEPGGDRDRAAANRLYETAGFVEVDRLMSFRLRR